MNHKTRISLLTLVGFSLAPVTINAQTENKWSLDVSMNMFLAGLSGDVTAHGVPAHLNASFGDIFDHLDVAAAGRATMGYDRWFMSTEFSYLKLKASVPAARANFEQWLVEPSLGYQVCNHFAAFAGARYNNLSGDVSVTGPLGNIRSTIGTQEWWDPIIGGLVSVPLIGNALTLDGRFDIGGFGVGSDLTWQAYPYLSWRFAKWGSAQLGYRWLGTDYETGSGTSKCRYDVVVQGPQVGLTVHL